MTASTGNAHQGGEQKNGCLGGRRAEEQTGRGASGGEEIYREMPHTCLQPQHHEPREGRDPTVLLPTAREIPEEHLCKIKRKMRSGQQARGWIPECRAESKCEEAMHNNAQQCLR